MPGQIEARLKELGIKLPEASSPAARYANAVIVDGLMYVSGKGPAGSPRGKLGFHYSTEQGYAFARSAGIEVLGRTEGGAWLSRPGPPRGQGAGIHPGIAGL